ncbi:MAG: NF038122 family metalloprotease [Isosphaeraceae bacterium]
MNPRHCLKKSGQFCCRGVWATLVACSALALLGNGTPARANLTINATFDSSITSLPGAAAIEGAINGAIGAVEAQVSSPNNITVAIDFTNMSTGLGESTTAYYALSYYNYYNAFQAVATSPAQLTALASLGPAPGPSSGNPVNGTPNVIITSAEGRNLGFNTPGGVTGPSGGTFDTVIGLNTSITYPPQPNNGSNYGLQAVANHEIDESLGIGGAGSTIGGTGFFATGVGDLDLYRYTAPGVRSYSTTQTTSPYSYFSINGGNTVLSYFNQTSGADYGDWLSNPIPAGYGPQVQDAFGTPGTNPALGPNELAAFSAIGYELTPVPEPSSMLVAVLGALGLSAYGWRRRKQRAEETVA